MKQTLVLPLILAFCTLLSGCIVDRDYHHEHRHHHHDDRRWR